MEFTHEQISEIISEITNGELGLQGLVKQGLESLMLSERDLHNETRGDVSNGFRGRRVCHGGKVFELRVPRSRNNHFYPMLLGVLKDQEEEAQKLVSSLYCSGLTTEQVGKIYEQFYGKHYSKSQVSRLLNTAREDVNAWLGRELDNRYPIIYIDATYVLTRRDDSVSNEAYYTVLGVKEDRTREVLAVVNFPTESATNWKDVFEDLKERGVAVIDLLVCDGLPGIENVLAETFPKADLQLCTVHLKRNIAGKVKPRDKKQVMEELKQVCAPDQWEISPEKAFEKFKEFIAKGNVMDMAVGVIIGGAFGKIVSSLVNDILMPPIGALIGNTDFSQLRLDISKVRDITSSAVQSVEGIVTKGDAAQAAAAAEPIYWNYGAFIQQCVDFTILALCVFLMVKLMNRLMKKNEEAPAPAPAPEPPAPSKEELLLTEIRDLLKEQKK